MVKVEGKDGIVEISSDPDKQIVNITAGAWFEVGDVDLTYDQAVVVLDALREAVQSLRACPYTFAHTRHWCGYAGCRDA